MRKLVSITGLVLLLGIPTVAPLIAAMSCCPQPCESMLRPPSSCCKVSALPENATPGRLATTPQLAEPALAGPRMGASVTLGETPATVISHPRHSVFLQTPLRI